MNDQPHRSRSRDLLRQIMIGGSILAVLSCTILGSGVLTMQEGTLRSASGVRATAAPERTITSAPSTPTVPRPATNTLSAGHTPTAGATPTRKPTTPAAPTETSTVLPTRTHTATSTSIPTRTPTGTPTSAPTETIAPTRTLPPPTATACVVSPPFSWRSFVVQPGETLSQLARRHGTTTERIMEVNCLASTTIYRDSRLYLPALPPTATTQPTATPTGCVPNPPPGWALYVTQPGDTLYSLSLDRGVSVTEIQRVNCLPDQALPVNAHIYLPALATATPSWTQVVSPTVETPTATATLPSGETATPQPTLTVTLSPTATQDAALTPTPEPTPTLVTETPTATSETPTTTPSTSTPPPTETATPSPTATHTPTIEPTPPEIPTVTPTP